MTLEFTNDGLSIDNLQDITDALAQAYRDIYGQDINLAPESPDGQRVGIEAKARADLQSMLLQIYNAMDPDTASGDFLTRVSKYAGITRRPPTRSQADVEITTDRPVTLPEAFTVEDDLGQSWVIDAEQAIPSGTTTVTLFAEEFGSVEADANTITEVVTIVLGVTSVTNPSDALVGVAEETDEELRLRRRRSVQLPAFTPVGSIFSRLANLSGVTDAVVYENDQDTTDTERNIAPHTIWAVIEGGDVADIAETLARSKTAGTGTKGASVGTYVETLERPGFDDFEVEHSMRFDRPTDVPIYVRMNVSPRRAGATIDQSAIKQALADKDFAIAENCVASELYDEVYSAGTNFFAFDLEVSDDNSTWVDTRVVAGFAGKCSIDALNVTITEV